MKTKMIKELPEHYVMHDGKDTFRVAKDGLSDVLHAKIRKMAEPIKAAEGVQVPGYGFQPTEPPDTNPSPLLSSQPEPLGPDTAVYAPALIPPIPPYVQPLTREQELLATPGFDKEAYENAKKGKFPAGGPEAYFAMHQRAGEIDAEKIAKDKAKALGIHSPEETPKGEAPEVPPPAPTVLPPIGGPGVGPALRINSSESDAAYAAQKAAERARQSVEAEGARNLAAAEGEHQKQLAANALEQKEMAQRARAESQTMLAKIQQSSDEMAKLDMTVDPGRFWASRTTGQKIAGILGMVLGSLGTGPDGVNRAAGLMDRAITRDVEAQKAEYDLRLRKGSASIAAATSMYGLHHQQLQDDIAATAAAKATGDEIAISKLNQIKNSTAGNLAAPQADLLIAALSQDQAKNHQTVSERVSESALKRAIGASEIAKNYAEAEHARAEAGKAALGAGANPAEVKELHTAEASAQNSLDLIKKIKTGLATTNSIIPGKTTYNQNIGTDAAALAADQTALVLELKNVAKLGQISAGDQALLDRLTGDPQSFWTSEGSKVAKLNALQDIVLRSVKNQRNAIHGAQATVKP